MSMTKEEKINTLKAIIQECEEYQWQRKETLFEIIKDLEQEPILDKIRERVELEKLGYPPSAEYYKAIMKVLQIIDKYHEPQAENKE